MIRTFKYLLLALCLTQATTATGSVTVNIEDDQVSHRSQRVNTGDANKIDDTASALSIHLATDIVYLGAQAVKPLFLPTDTNYQGMIFYINLARGSTLVGANGYALSDVIRNPTKDKAFVAALLLLHAAGDIAHALSQRAGDFSYRFIQAIPILYTLMNTFGEYVSDPVLLAAVTSTILIYHFKGTGDLQKILAFAKSVILQEGAKAKKRN
jgi:hypothetical protein